MSTPETEKDSKKGEPEVLRRRVSMIQRIKQILKTQRAWHDAKNQN